MLRKASLLLSGHATAALLTLARNLLIARMIPVADFGIAATLALAMAIVEMATTLGLQQQIVQARGGDDPRFQAALQGFQLLRGILAGLALLALAHPLAAVLKVPEAAPAYMILGIVPVLNALQHFDIHRLNRRMSYGPLLLTGVVPALLALLAVWPLVALFGDWRAMLWSILIQAVFAAIVSHLVAERPFRMVFDRAQMASSVRFGWPLLLNGVLLFAVMQGDKLIVGRLSGMEALAVFALGVTLTLTPTLVLARTTQNLFLPRLSAVDPASNAFAVLGRATLEMSLLNGALLILVVAGGGAMFVTAVLGEKYAALVALILPFAVLHAVRVWKTGAAVVALSQGQTSNGLMANLPRVAALPFAWVLLAQGGTLVQLIWLGTVAEMVGLALALVLVVRRARLAITAYLPALGLAMGMVLVCVVPYVTPPFRLWVVLALMIGMALVSRDLFHAIPLLRGPLPKGAAADGTEQEKDL